MNPYSIYIVDDEKSVRQGLTFGLKKHYKVKAFPSAEDALAVIGHEAPDLILLDIGLPGMNGIEALKEIKGILPNILVIMVTAYEDIQTVISAMKLGAHDYVIKPIHMDTLKVTIENSLETIRLHKEVQSLQERYIKENLPCFIGESHAIQDVMGFIKKVANSPDTPILITGESGTGKELIASAIHYKSPHFKGPFVTLNCAAIPRELVESELFGYEKGAFSGAGNTGKKGLIETAADGTLFLDEVGDLSLEAQAKLLRFIEEGEYYRVGGTRKYKVQTRIVSATNKDLMLMVDEGLFRLDLFYRLAVVKVNLPSLNERSDDILPIARHFLLEYIKKHEKAIQGITTQAEEFLTQHHWQGNIRELRNLIERGVLVGGGTELTLEDLGVSQEKRGADIPLIRVQGEEPFSPLPDEGIELEALEAHYIREALKMSGDNDARAAQLLGLSYYAFRYRKKKLKSAAN